MAICRVRRVVHAVAARPVTGLAALSAVFAVALVGPAHAFATPHVAPHTAPSVTSVQKQLGQLALENIQLVEKYDQARVTVAQRQQAAVDAQAAAVQARIRYSAAHMQFVQIIRSQYEGQSLGAAGALLSSDSGTNYLDRLDALDMISNHTAQVVAEVGALRKRAAAASATADAMLARAKAQRDLVAEERTSVTKQIAKYRTLLATLTSAQRAAYQRAANLAVSHARVVALQKTLQKTPATTPQTTPQTTQQTTQQKQRGTRHTATPVTAAGTGAARVAVQFALNQVGKPYVWGSGGPRSYDCSGLTMASWRAAGVGLPHSAAGQYGYGHHVSRSELAPGDLIFFYRPIGHVTIYIGGGMMVSAPTEGQNVSVVPLSAFDSSYTGATRLT